MRSEIRAGWLVVLLWWVSASPVWAVGSHSSGIVGILPLPQVFGRVPCDRFEPQDVMLYDSPDKSLPVGHIYVRNNWSFSPQGGCGGLEVAVAGFGESFEKLPRQEYDYGQPGVIVTAREGGWFEIRLAHRRAWLQGNPELFLPVTELLTDALTFMRLHEGLALYEAPATGEPVWVPDGALVVGTLPVEVLDIRDREGQLWVQVSIISENICGLDPLPLDSHTGWLPFHDPEGEPAVWFYSRGC